MTIEELRAKLEVATRERDEAWTAWEKGTMFLADAERERDEARAEITKLAQDRDDATRAWDRAEALRNLLEAHERSAAHCDRVWGSALSELQEARAEAGMLEDRLSESRSEVDRLTDERDELLVRVADQGAELRATREAYRESQADLTRERIGIRPVDEVRSDAYRRGAEAMREAIASHVRGPGNELIRAWRIPEER
jgi:hypothetical protein